MTSHSDSQPASSTPSPLSRSSSAHPLDEAASALVDAGSGWARYGLQIARLYVRGAARLLDATATGLQHIAEHLDTRADAPSPAARAPGGDPPAPPSPIASA